MQRGLHFGPRCNLRPLSGSGAKKNSRDDAGGEGDHERDREPAESDRDSDSDDLFTLMVFNQSRPATMSYPPSDVVEGDVEGGKARSDKKTNTCPVFNSHAEADRESTEERRAEDEEASSTIDLHQVKLPHGTWRMRLLVPNIAASRRSAWTPTQDRSGVKGLEVETFFNAKRRSAQAPGR
jgi:hypothetical protein